MLNYHLQPSTSFHLNLYLAWALKHCPLSLSWLSVILSWHISLLLGCFGCASHWALCANASASTAFLTLIHWVWESQRKIQWLTFSSFSCQPRADTELAKITGSTDLLGYLLFHSSLLYLSYSLIALFVRAYACVSSVLHDLFALGILLGVKLRFHR